jgi:phosphoribosylanthranilate isomerase
VTRIKICGITNLEDALAAVAAGADALGFNFYEKSPRYLTPEAARAVVREMPPEVLCVGVFVNESREAIESAVAESCVAAAQLHGDEPPEFCEGLSVKSIIKALRGREGFDAESATVYKTEAILLDAYDPRAWGGTGRTCDWESARRVREAVPRLYLAGGLTPENVADAIRAVGPYGVDVCGGVERAPGLKEHALVRKFVAAVRDAPPKD